MRRPEKEEIPYILAIVVTSFGILYNIFPVSISNVLILLGIDLLLSMAWKRSMVLSRVETLLKRELFSLTEVHSLAYQNVLERRKKASGQCPNRLVN